MSDVLSASASAGVRHAWRYRSLFENALREQKVFDKLGRVDRDLRWGKLKAEKWKRSVQNVLSLWEGWCVFPQASQNALLHDFLNSPSNEEEKQATQVEKNRKESELQRAKVINKWKSVVDEHSVTPQSEDVVMDDVDGVAMIDDDVEGGAMAEEDLIDEDLDGIPMMDSSDENTEDPDTGISPPDGETVNEKKGASRKETLQTIVPGRRQRMKAVDMFADDSDA